MDEHPKTVTVKALEAHSYMGTEYAVGDTYEIDEQYVDSVAAQGKATRVEVASAAPMTAAPASQPVAPMTTDTLTEKPATEAKPAKAVAKTKPARKPAAAAKRRK